VKRWLVAASLWVCAAHAARSQDFEAASPPLTTRAPDALLDRALPSATPALAASAAQTRWWGLPGLETRSVSAGASLNTWRVALGFSQTGEPEVGWTTLGIGFGAASRHAGAGVRACARSDRDAAYRLTRTFDAAAGAEAGVGAWLDAADGVRVCASAPQVWTSATAPPLARPLELGLRVGDANAVWLRLVSPRAGDDGERALGLTLYVAPVSVWAEVRDGPLRGSVGIAGRIAQLRVDVRVDAHPVLGETTRVALAWVRESGRAP
jgi:hypothetical protein